MGRAQAGAQASATVGFAVVSRARDAQARPFTLPEAQRTAMLFVGYGHHALAKASAADAKLARGMLDAGLPQQWVLDTAVAQAAATVRHPEGERALRRYLSARLAEERPLLIAEGVLSQREAFALGGQRIDDQRAWAALRAADLLKARDALAGAELHGEEGELARRHVCEACAQTAREQFADREQRPDAQQTVIVLVLAKSLSSPELAGARRVLYDEGALSSTRKMMAEQGFHTDMPAVFVDFSELEAVFDYPGFAEKIAGFQNAATGVVALNSGPTLQRMLQHRARGEHSKALVHELVHTRQREAEDGKRPAIADDQTVAEQALADTLREGATDSEARLLLAEQPAFERLDEAVYLEERMFVQALASLSATNDAPARGFIRRLATSGARGRAAHASARLLSREGPEAYRALALAHWRYQREVDGLYDRAYERGEYEEPGSWHPSHEELIELAGAHLAELARMGPEAYSAQYSEPAGVV